MRQLAQLQQHFQRYLMDDSQAVDSHALDNNWIVDDTKVGATKRLGIYHNAYRMRIIEALASPYGGLKKLLGPVQFQAIALGYLNRYPSTYPNLRWYGSKMADYLQTVLPHNLVATEMATFEWALAAAFDAPDVTVVTLQDLAEIPPAQWGELTFVFQPGLQLLALQTNAVPTWKALNDDEAPPQPDHQQHLHWLIWRQQMDANFRSLDNTEATLLAQACDGLSFGALCEKLFETVGEDATLQAAQYLAGWLETEMIADIHR